MAALPVLEHRIPPFQFLGLLSSLPLNPKLVRFASAGLTRSSSSSSSSSRLRRLPQLKSPRIHTRRRRPGSCSARGGMTLPPKCFSGSTADPIAIAGKPQFADFPDHAELRQPLKGLCEQLRVSSGIILAPEGINGSICGTRESVERVVGLIQSDERLNGLRQIESPVSPEDEALHHGHSSSSLAAGEDAPSIVSLGMPSVSPIGRVGKYVVIDVRNNYETRIGKFKGAIDPCTTAFREFPAWVENQFQPLEMDGEKLAKDHDVPKERMPQVAMYCTGGIRCEKASSFLLSKGFKEVYHLKGGILKYLEEVPKSESLWEGECFVFDKRVSVEHGLAQGTFNLCYGCKKPVSDADMESPEWEYGVSCPYCYSSKSEEEKERVIARQRQFETWGIIGGPHKGRRPITSSDNNKSTINRHSSSL
ncbi:hypothetical protein BT93_G2354 [Corymbia citriodora subsp. variegata]|nr:hypothetical protein BT93_G2354 [Corymbia citriodora subsp. variegata]